MRLQSKLSTLVSVGLFSLSILISHSLFAAQLVDKIIVEIDNQIITHAELEKRITDIQQQLKKRKGSVPTRAQLRNKVLDRMVLDTLQVNRAQQYGINLSTVDLNNRVEALARQNKLTVQQLRQALISDGVNFQDFREQVRRDTIILRAQKQLVMDKIKVSDHEIDQFLANQKNNANNDIEFKLAHILIAIPESADPEAIQTSRQRAVHVLKRSKNKEAFDKLAVEFSDAPEAIEGGDLGWRALSELPSLFVNAIKNLKKGQVSTLVQSPSGFHILKLLDKKVGEQVIVEETLARHILIKTDAVTKDDAAREQLKKIRQEIANGADFNELAKLHSEDIGSKGTGGSLGWSVRGSFVPQFEAVIKSLQKNQLSEPFRTQYGWHIVEVLDRRQSDKTNIVARNKAYQAIQQSKAAEALQLWLRQLRDEAYINYHNNADKPS